MRDLCELHYLAANPSCEAQLDVGFGALIELKIRNFSKDGRIRGNLGYRCADYSRVNMEISRRRSSCRFCYRSHNYAGRTDVDRCTNLKQLTSEPDTQGLRKLPSTSTTHQSDLQVADSIISATESPLRFTSQFFWLYIHHHNSLCCCYFRRFTSQEFYSPHLSPLSFVSRML